VLQRPGGLDAGVADAMSDDRILDALNALTSEPAPIAKDAPSVKEMVVALNRELERPRMWTDVDRKPLRGARDYILSASATIAAKDAEIARLNICPWCGSGMDRLPVDGGAELGCTSETCPSQGIGVWCYAEKLRNEIAEMRAVLGSKCECGHWLRIHHSWLTAVPQSIVRCNECPGEASGARRACGTAAERGLA
jgi:hypothetical protein